MLDITNHQENASQTTSYHFITTRMARIKNVGNKKYWQECGELGTLIYCECECTMAQPIGKPSGSSSKL